MERYMGTDQEAKRSGRFMDDQHGVERPGTRGHYSGHDSGHRSVGPAENEGLERTEPHSEQFEPVTVRAAARVLQLQRASVVSLPEARFYLQELAAMDRYAGAGAFASLLRRAQSHLAAELIAGVKAGIGSEQSHVPSPKNSAQVALA